MSTSDEKAIETLNGLIEIAEDGEKGFTEAAKGVKDAELRILLNQYAAQRGEFVRELQAQVTAMGGEAETSGTTAGAIHRGWIDVKAAVTGRDDHAIVAECERGEDAAKEAYEKALNGNDLPTTLLPMVQRQYGQIREAHDRVRDIRDTARV